MKGNISKSILLQVVLIVSLLAADTALHAVWYRSMIAQPAQQIVAPPAEAQPPSASPTQPAPVSPLVEPAEAAVTTYLYRLDDAGQAVWYAVGEIPPGALVKRGACQADGYAQVEYQHPDRPNYWRVEHVRCNGHD